MEMLELHVLGVNRGFDVPGWRIPSLYFQYLRAGHAGHVLPVFEHNEHDLLTLVALTAHVSRILEQPSEVDLQAAEWFGLGKMYGDLGEFMEKFARIRAWAGAAPVRDVAGGYAATVELLI